MYAEQYPDRVAGMVLMDAAHPEQVKRYSAFRTSMENYLQEGSVYPWLARLGLFRLYFALGGEFDFADLPLQQQVELEAMWSTPEYQESGLKEVSAAMDLYGNPPPQQATDCCHSAARPT